MFIYGSGGIGLSPSDCADSRREPWSSLVSQQRTAGHFPGTRLAAWWYSGPCSPLNGNTAA